MCIRDRRREGGRRGGGEGDVAVTDNDDDDQKEDKREKEAIEEHRYHSVIVYSLWTKTITFKSVFYNLPYSFSQLINARKTIPHSVAN